MKHFQHEHPHSEEHGHGHTHGIVDPSITTSSKGLWAVKWSFVALMVTAIFQIFIVILSQSVALLADTIHNFGDAATAIPLGIAFMFAKRKPTKRFSYGLGRVEDLAGIVVVLIILFSAIVAGYQAIQRFLHPQEVTHLGAVIAASLIGFLGNEIVATFRIKVGKEINSAALIADGYHARTDGWTSLAVLFGAIGVWFGFPLADPLIGLGITGAILFIVWDSAKAIFLRVLDGVEPEVLHEIEHAIEHVDGIRGIESICARWIGHELNAELQLKIDAKLSIAEGEKIADKIRQELHHHFQYLFSVTIEFITP